METMTYRDALKRIEELEKEVEQLKEEINRLHNRNFGGRKKHDEMWMETYQAFVEKYKGGQSIKEIVAEGEFSRRTAYRYLAYYKQLQNKEGET